MTWLYEKAAAGGPVPVDVLAEGLFAARGFEPVLPLEFGPAEPPVALPADKEEQQHQAEVREAQERAHQVRLMVDAARIEAVAETRDVMGRECRDSIQAERARVDDVLSQFADERARWFRRSEGEIVQLALAIARRVLSREMKLDPLCLREIAHEAVARVQDQSGVVLRVSPAGVADWRGAFSSRPDLEVLADATVPDGKCLVDTTFGRVELGVDVQLEEISERFREMVGGPRRMLVRDDAPARVAL